MQTEIVDLLENKEINGVTLGDFQKNIVRNIQLMFVQGETNYECGDIELDVNLLSE